MDLIATFGFEAAEYSTSIRHSSIHWRARYLCSSRTFPFRAKELLVLIRQLIINVISTFVKVVHFHLLFVGEQFFLFENKKVKLLLISATYQIIELKRLASNSDLL